MDGPFVLREYVRQLVEEHFVDSARPGPVRYRMDREVKIGRVETVESIESEHFTMARLLAVNGTPLSAADREAEARRLQNLATDPEAQRQQQRTEQDEEARVRKLLRALPDAFVFTAGGLATGRDGATWRRLDFRSDPAYRARDRETSILSGMAGSLWVDAAEERLVKVEGKLVRDVAFGWGILGKLRRGGDFMIELQRTASGRYLQVGMNLDFRAKLLMGLSSAHLLDRRTVSEIRPVANRLAPNVALELLETSERRADARRASPGR
jgi:hypothetical protein